MTRSTHVGPNTSVQKGVSMGKTPMVSLQCSHSKKKKNDYVTRPNAAGNNKIDINSNILGRKETPGTRTKKKVRVTYKDSF